MYTGPIEEVGRVGKSEQSAGGCRLRIKAETDRLSPDESIGVSGVCLTAEAVGEGWFEAFCSSETVERTYLSQLQPGAAVNIERLLAVSGTFGGHVVKETVGTTTEILAIDDQQEATQQLTIALPEGYEQHITEKEQSHSMA